MKRGPSALALRIARQLLLERDRERAAVMDEHAAKAAKAAAREAKRKAAAQATKTATGLERALDLKAASRAKWAKVLPEKDADAEC